MAPILFNITFCFLFDRYLRKTKFYNFFECQQNRDQTTVKLWNVRNLNSNKWVKILREKTQKSKFSSLALIMWFYMWQLGAGLPLTSRSLTNHSDPPASLKLSFSLFVTFHRSSGQPAGTNTAYLLLLIIDYWLLSPQLLSLHPFIFVFKESVLQSQDGYRGQQSVKHERASLWFPWQLELGYSVILCSVTKCVDPHLLRSVILLWLFFLWSFHPSILPLSARGRASIIHHYFPPLPPALPPRVFPPSFSCRPSVSGRPTQRM